jgi:hypothetical protein
MGNAGDVSSSDGVKLNFRIPTMRLQKIAPTAKKKRERNRGVTYAWRYRQLSQKPG